MSIQTLGEKFEDDRREIKGTIEAPNYESGLDKTILNPFKEDGLNYTDMARNAPMDKKNSYHLPLALDDFSGAYYFAGDSAKTEENSSNELKIDKVDINVENLKRTFKEIEKQGELVQKDIALSQKSIQEEMDAIMALNELKNIISFVTEENKKNPSNDILITEDSLQKYKEKAQIKYLELESAIYKMDSGNTKSIEKYFKEEDITLPLTRENALETLKDLKSRNERMENSIDILFDKEKRNNFLNSNIPEVKETFKKLFEEIDKTENKRALNKDNNDKKMNGINLNIETAKHIIEDAKNKFNFFNLSPLFWFDDLKQTLKSLYGMSLLIINYVEKSKLEELQKSLLHIHNGDFKSIKELPTKLDAIKLDLEKRVENSRTDTMKNYLLHIESSLQVFDKNTFYKNDDFLYDQYGSKFDELFKNKQKESYLYTYLATQGINPKVENLFKQLEENKLSLKDANFIDKMDVLSPEVKEEALLVYYMEETISNNIKKSYKHNVIKENNNDFSILKPEETKEEQKDNSFNILDVQRLQNNEKELKSNRDEDIKMDRILDLAQKELNQKILNKLENLKEGIPTEKVVSSLMNVSIFSIFAQAMMEMNNKMGNSNVNNQKNTQYKESTLGKLSTDSSSTKKKKYISNDDDADEEKSSKKDKFNKDDKKRYTKK